MPSTPVEQFVETLPIAGMLASSLVIPGAGDPLRQLCSLKSDQLKAAIEAFSLSLHQMLKTQLDYLKTLLDAKESKAQEDADGSGSKCAVFVMNAGSVKAYHEGIYERIGEHIITNYHTRDALFGQKIFLFTYSSSSHERTAGTCLPC